jgi:hypothetical protein
MRLKLGQLKSILRRWQLFLVASRIGVQMASDRLWIYNNHLGLLESQKQNNLTLLNILSILNLLKIFINTVIYDNLLVTLKGILGEGKKQNY